MIDDGTSDVAQIETRRRKVTLKMARQKAVNQIGKTVQRKQPSEEKVPAAPLGKGLIAGDGDPPGKGAPREEAVAVAEDAQYAGGVEGQPANFDPADRRTVQLVFGVDRQHGRIGIAARNAPMEHRMGVENLQ